VVCLMILANFSFGVLSSMRAYVGGESVWSKAQKDAVFHLQKYAAGRTPGELHKFAPISPSIWETMQLA